MYVKTLKIRDLRSFHFAEFDFLVPGLRPSGTKGPRLGNVNVILGTNGSGKSTVLDAIALSLLSPIVSSSGYRPYALIRRSNRGTVQKSEIAIQAVVSGQDVPGYFDALPEDVSMQITVERKGDVEFVSASNVPAGFEEYYYDKSPAFFFVGYGAMRVVDVEGQGDVSSRRKLRHNRYERVASLFEDQYTLSPLSRLCTHCIGYGASDSKLLGGLGSWRNFFG